MDQSVDARRAWIVLATTCVAFMFGGGAPTRAAAAEDAVAATAAPTAPAEVALSEAIRDRIDHLRYETQHDIRGSRIVADELVARFYESRQFQPVWQDTSRRDALVTAVAELVDDGLDPSVYHLDSLQSYRLDRRMGTPLTPQDRADLDLVATDAFLLAAYHLYLGSVDPRQLSPQWNFSERPIEIERGLAALNDRLAAGQIRETLEAARPKHVWY